MKIENLLIDLQLAENVFSDTPEFKEGEVFKARISQIIDDLIILNMGNGKQIEAKIVAPIDLKDISPILHFTVKEIIDNKIFIRPSIQNEIDASNKLEKESKIIEVLKSFDLKPDKDKIELVEKLMKNNIQVTKQNIQNLYKAELFFRAIEEPVKSGKIQIVESDLNKDVTTLAKELFVGDRSINVAEKSSENIKAFDKTQLPTTQTINIRDVDSTKLIFLLKNNLKINLENITQLNNIILKDWSVAKQVHHLVDLLIKDDSTSYMAKEIISVLENFKTNITKKLFNPEQLVEDLQIKLEEIKRGIEKLPLNSAKETLKNIEVLQKGFEFIRQINNSEVYLQIPIWLEQQFKDLDIFIYKNKRGNLDLNKDECSILLVLDTKNLRKIKVLIKIKQSNIDCNFYTETEKIQNLIKKHQDILQKILICLGFNQIHISFIISTMTDKILDFESQLNNDISKLNFIDLRV